MKITLGQLRHLLREIKIDTRTQRVVSSVANAAETYVDSVVAGSPDSQAAKALQTYAEEAANYARWMATRGEPKSDSVGQLAKHASDLAELSGFWKRPAFLGKDEYVQRLKDLLRRLQHSQIKIMVN